ncbi:hypothetical protein ACIA8E_38220 [Streptomyces sp. NPDC051664]|uniref:hypothetical protein n=1 Tax=Streptomyces sp. NPDC051664 TaxID=3365668 RepID=UPI00379571CB
MDETDELEFVGDITDYWSYTQVRDWVLLKPGMSRTALHLYLLLRAMVSESARRTGGGLRRMSVDQLCYLLPGINDKPASPTMVKDALRLLDEHGLVVNPDGGRLVTSTGKGGIQNTFRKYQVNDLPPDTYEGWRNVWDKLDAYTPDWRQNPAQPPVHTRTGDGVQQSVGRKSDHRSDQDRTTKTPGGFDGRISDEPGRKSDQTGRKKNARKPLTSKNTVPKEAPQRSLSLSPSSSAPPAPVAGADAGTGQTRETAAPDDKPASAAAGVPAPREGANDSEQTAQVVAMLTGLPGNVHRDDALDLVSLVGEALTVGWTLSQLRGHLSRKCDPERVYDAAAIYRKHLKRLPVASTRTGAHPAAAAPECDKCNGSGLAEDPETFMPIGPCECRMAPVLAGAF